MSLIVSHDGLMFQSAWLRQQAAVRGVAFALVRFLRELETDYVFDNQHPANEC